MTKSLVILIPEIARDWPVASMPVSTRLERILSRIGCVHLGDLQNVPYEQISRRKNCGKQTLEELQSLLTRIESGKLRFSTGDVRLCHAGDEVRGRAISEFQWSVRCYNCLMVCDVRTVGDLAQMSESELLRVKNFGRKSLSEVKALLASVGLQLGMKSSEDRLRSAEGQQRIAEESSSTHIFVPQSARGWALSQMPISARLSGVLERLGARLLGDLQGVSFDEVAKVRNCGRRTLAELRAFVRRVQAGEFDIANASVEGLAAAYVIRFVDDTLDRLPSRTRDIVSLRFGGKDEERMTLDEIGRKYGLTRERVRQIVDATTKQMHKSGWLALGELLKRIAEKCITAVCPLTPVLLTQWLGPEARASRYPMSFYIRLLNELLPEIPGWPEHQKPASNVGRSAEIVRCLRELLRADITARPLQIAFEELRVEKNLSKLTAREFLDAVRRDDSVTVEFTTPSRPELRASKLTTREWVRLVLSQTDSPLTPEEIIRQGRELLGGRISPPSPFTLANMVRPEDGFYWLDRRAVGLRQHFRLPLPLWDKVRSDFCQLLRDENRPISTSEVCNDNRFNWTRLANAYEIAQVLREDRRFIDLGRFLFGLTKWGIEEREYVNDLIPKVLARVGHPTTTAEVCMELKRFRSVTPTSMSAVLRKSGDVRDYGFGYYGLTSWGDDAKDFLVSEAPFVNRIIARSEPPFTFGALCEVLEITPDTRLAQRLWRTIQYLPKVRVESETLTAEALLSHKSWSLERALYTVLGRADQPLPAYEIQWKVNEYFAATFSDRSLTQIENCLGRSSLFVRNAGGEYLLGTYVEHYTLDVGSIRQTCLEILSSRNEIVGCDDLLERIGAEGIEEETLSPSMLAALLRGDEAFEEVGTNRFRARP